MPNRDAARAKKAAEIEDGLMRLADRLELEWSKLPPPSPNRGVLFIRGGHSPASQLLQRAKVDAARLLLEAVTLDLLPNVHDIVTFNEVVKLPGDHFDEVFQVLSNEWLPLCGVSKSSSDLGVGYALADTIRAMAAIEARKKGPKEPTTSLPDALGNPRTKSVPPRQRKPQIRITDIQRSFLVGLSRINDGGSKDDPISTSKIGDKMDPPQMRDQLRTTREKLRDLELIGTIPQDRNGGCWLLALGRKRLPKSKDRKRTPRN